MSTQVMIADETDLALLGVREVLSRSGNYQITGLYQVLPELLDGLRRAAPQAVLLSDRLEPTLDVLALVAQVRAAAPQTHQIVMSNHADGAVLHELLRAGVAGYLYKGDLLSEDVITALKTVMRGRPYLSPTANAEYLLALQSDRMQSPFDPEARAVLAMLAQGYRPQEIALKRGVPVRRIYWVGNKLRRRFGAETNEHLIARAAEEGFLP